MKALIKPRGLPPQLVSTVPDPTADGVTVAMRTVGLCRTDLRVASGTLEAPDGLVLGHEGAGVVVQDPSGQWASGTSVVVHPLTSDGGFLGLNRPGLLQDQVVVPADRLIRNPGLAHDVAAYLEPVAASMAVLKAPIRPTQRGLIVQDNRIAHLTVLILRSLGYDIDWRREARYTGPQGFYDYAIETQFDTDSVHDQIGALRHGGCLVVKSRHYQPVTVHPAMWVDREITLCAVRYHGFDDALHWLAHHQNLVAPLLGRHYALENWSEAFQDAADPHAPKLFIDLNG